MEIFLLKGQCCSGNSSGLRCTIILSFKLPFFMLQLIPAINLLMNPLSKCMCNILYDIKLTVTVDLSWQKINESIFYRSIAFKVRCFISCQDNQIDTSFVLVKKKDGGIQHFSSTEPSLMCFHYPG